MYTLVNNKHVYNYVRIDNKHVYNHVHINIQHMYNYIHTNKPTLYNYVHYVHKLNIRRQLLVLVNQETDNAKNAGI